MSTLRARLAELEARLETLSAAVEALSRAEESPARAELPAVSKKDAGKVLTVNGSGKWAAAKLPE